MNLTDLLLSENNGAAVSELSRRFGLQHNETVQAIEALMPAFSHGLKRNVSSPQGAASLIEALAGGNHLRYIENPNHAASAAGVGDGNAILGHIFGNKDVSRAVAAHAAQSTGITSAILKKMLPVIASMVMGALFKGSKGGAGGLGGMLGSAAGGGLLGTIIEGLAGGVLSGGRQQTRQRSRRRRSTRSKAPGSLEDLLGGLLGGGQRRAPQRRRADPIMPPARDGSAQPTGGGSLGDLLEQLGGGQARQSRRANQRTPQRRTRSPRRRRGGLEKIFGDMLEPGGHTDSGYRQQTGSVFDEFLGPSR